MKQKKIAILIVLVMGIWGLIGYRIYSHLRDEPSVLPRKKRVVEVVEVGAEDLALVLIYPDPFLKEHRRAPVVQPQAERVRTVSVKKTVATPVQRLYVNWSKITYQGVMHNATRKNKTATVTINGTDYFLREGETGDGVRVVRIHSDSIEVAVEGERKFIRRRSE